MQAVQASGSNPAGGPLAGLNVAELGQLIAGPFAAKTLFDFGADVIKVEPPGTPGRPGSGGDALRNTRCRDRSRRLAGPPTCIRRRTPGLN